MNNDGSKEGEISLKKRSMAEDKGTESKSWNVKKRNNRKEVK